MPSAFAGLFTLCLRSLPSRQPDEPSAGWSGDQQTIEERLAIIIVDDSSCRWLERHKSVRAKKSRRLPRAIRAAIRDLYRWWT